MKHSHLTTEDVDLLVETDSDEVAKRTFFHLLSICPECYAAGGDILDLYLAGEVALDFDSVSVGLALSRVEAPALWTELQDLDAQAQKELVQSDERFWSWGLAELLCRSSTESAADDSAAAVQIAELAVAVSMKVEDWGDDNLWLNLLRGFAWAHVAEARQIAGDWRGAWRALTKAKELWDPAFANAGDVLGYEARFVAITEGPGTENPSC